MKKHLIIQLTVDAGFEKTIIDASVAMRKLSIVLHKLDNRSPFEKFYDFMTDLISNGKSFAPNELKSFKL